MRRYNYSLQLWRLSFRYRLRNHNLNYPEEDHESRESDNSATIYIQLANAAYSVLCFSLLAYYSISWVKDIDEVAHTYRNTTT